MTTLIASEVERVRAPERASEEAAASFLRAVLARRIGDRDDLLARGKELGTDLAARRRGARRARPRPQPDRGRLAPAAAGRRRPRRSLDRLRLDRALRPRPATARWSMLIPDADGETGRRVAAAVLRELESGLAGFAFAIGRSRRAEDPLDLQRAVNEALLAAQRRRGRSRARELAYEETGTYQLLLPYMSDPAELKRFYRRDRPPARRLRRAVRDRSARHAGHVPGLRRQRQRDRRAAHHPPPHDPLPVRARARADRPRRLLDRRPREAVARAEGDAGTRDRGAAGAVERAGRRRRARTALSDLFRFRAVLGLNPA